MRLYESEIKKFMGLYNIEIPTGEVAYDSKKAEEIASRLGSVVIKADVLAKGRKEAGGILFADSPIEAEREASKLLGKIINGEKVERVLVEEKIPILNELYFGITLDRANHCYVAVACSEGGMNIEDVARTSPEKVIKKLINPEWGFHRYQAREIARKLGYTGKQGPDLESIFFKFYNMARDYDVGELAELNPVIETPDGKFVVAHARLFVDDAAINEHPELKPLMEERLKKLPPHEREAQEAGLSYVKLREKGNIGVISNGAGLAITTIDIIRYFNGEPANFLDIGGGASADRMAKALNVVLSDPNVKALFINILGGVTRCDDVARGILKAKEQLKYEKPMIIRLVGTNEEEGRRILTDADIPVLDSMEECAKMVVEIAKKMKNDYV